MSIIIYKIYNAFRFFSYFFDNKPCRYDHCPQSATYTLAKTAKAKSICLYKQK